jgi:transcription antitermination factor NusG
MNNASNAQWHIIYTKPGWEKRVSDNLRKKGIEQYCPLNNVEKQWLDKTKIIEEPLFASYIFVNLKKEQYTYISTISGIINFVYWLKKPAIVKHSEIEAIKTFLFQHKTVSIEKIAVNVNNDVTLTQEPLIHREGKVIQVNNSSVKINLPSIGYALIARVNKPHVIKNVFLHEINEEARLYQTVSIF